MPQKLGDGCESTQSLTPGVDWDGAGKVTVVWICSAPSPNPGTLRVATQVPPALPVADPNPITTDAFGLTTPLDVTTAGTALVGYNDSGGPRLAQRAGPSGGFGVLARAPGVDGDDSAGPVFLRPDGDLLAEFANSLGPTSFDIRAHVDDDDAPTLAISGPETVEVGQLATLSANAADDWAGLDAPVQWTFSDGTTATGPTVARTFTVPGNFQATATVSDRSGNTVTATKSILVQTPAPAEVCVVPKLRGLTLKKAKARLKKANCRAGKVRRPKKRKRGHRLLVRKQGLKAGRRLPVGTKVTLRLGNVKIKKQKTKRR